jgi:hypothetical protein
MVLACFRCIRIAVSFQSGKLIFAAALLLPSVLWAQTFPVRLERTGTNGVCDNLTANRMAVDPATGRVTLQGVTGLTCLPDGVAGLGNISVSAPAGPHASGVSGLSVVVQNIPAGATCTLRGVSNVQGNGIVGGQGWSDGTPLCTACSSSVTRTIDLTNVDTQANWLLQLNVQCSIQSGGYAVQAPIVASNAITVQPTPIVQGSCPYGENVPPTNHDGLTIASRQTTTPVSNGNNGSGLYPATDWSHFFGVSTGGSVLGRPLTSPGSTAQGYGFPGRFIGQTYFQLDRNKFIALRFRAPTPDANPVGNPVWTGVVSALGLYTAATPTSALSLAVAPCPGQFRDAPGAALPPACVVTNPNSVKDRINFVIVAPGVPYNGASCPIEAGKTYYFNVMAASPAVSLTTPLCSTTTCNYRMSRFPLGLAEDYP